MKKIYIETQVMPIPKKYFKHKHALGRLFGVALVWFRKKDAREYYKTLRIKCPKLETWYAEIKGFERKVK